MPSAKHVQIEQLQQAIQALETQRAILGEAVVDASVQALRKRIDELAPATPSSQQRKVATILFADIVDSTNFAQRLDPEDVLAIMDGALTRLAAVVEQHGGHIARFQGDGFKAIFGLDVSSESDPENAVHAGLDMLAAAIAYRQELAQEWRQLDFNIRVGVNTGLVITGGMTEAEDSISGLAVNLAARLESAAPPGGLLISHHTYQHVRGVFDVTPRQPIQAKGFPDPVPVYLVQQAKPRGFRVSTRGVEGVATRTIGRGAELATLQEAYRDTIDQSQTTVVTVAGAAGVGKSRLVYEFSNWLELQPEKIWHFKGRANQRTQSQAQFLLRDLFANQFQIKDSDPLPIVRQKFVAGISRFLESEGEKKAHILGSWLGYDFSDSPHLIRFQGEPQRIMDQATHYLAQTFAAAAAQDPAVILLDDIHWADNSSLDAVFKLARRQPALRLLIVCLTRPALFHARPAWGSALPTHQRINLNPLSLAMTRDLVAEILRQVEPLPQILIDLISNRAEGNPFYAEELVKMLIDEGAILTDLDTWRVVPEQLVALNIPSTLTGVLQTRLDKLQPEARRAAQQAAVIGRTFWDQALAALTAQAPAELPALEAREFIFHRAESAFAATNEYVFKHALLRDVTYETVLKRLRSQYHLQVAAWLVKAAGANARSKEFAALIGEHFELGGDQAQAALWYTRAGRQAQATYAHQEAIHFLSRALAFTPEANDAARFSLLEAREQAYDALGQREAQVKDLKQLVSLADRIDTTAQAKVALKQAHFAHSISEYDRAVEHSQTAVELARRANDKHLRVQAHLAWGNNLYRQGQYNKAQEQYQLGVVLAKEDGAQTDVAACLIGLGNVANDLADFTMARRCYEESMAIAQEMGNRRDEASCLNNLGTIANYQADYAAAQVYYAASLAIQSETGNRFGEGVLLGNLGLVATNKGDYLAARRYHQQSLSVRREIYDRYGEAGCLSNLGATEYLQGDNDRAAATLEEALQIQREIGDRWGEGNSLNELGAVALAAGNVAAAETNYDAALVIHQELNQPHYLAEDWAGLARVKLDQGDGPGASLLAQRVIAFTRDNPRLDGAEDPMRAFHFTWETVTALGDFAAAAEVLVHAAAIIQAFVAKNVDTAAQAMYLQQPHHAILWKAWQAKSRTAADAST